MYVRVCMCVYVCICEWGGVSTGACGRSHCVCTNMCVRVCVCVCMCVFVSKGIVRGGVCVCVYDRLRVCG